MAIVSNCIEYLSYKYGLSFYKVVNECSKEPIKKGYRNHIVSEIKIGSKESQCRLKQFNFS